jgi:hypothetical protein
VSRDGKVIVLLGGERLRFERERREGRHICIHMYDAYRWLEARSMAAAQIVRATAGIIRE